MPNNNHKCNSLCNKCNSLCNNLCNNRVSSNKWDNKAFNNSLINNRILLLINLDNNNRWCSRVINTSSRINLTLCSNSNRIWFQTNRDNLIICNRILRWIRWTRNKWVILIWGSNSNFSNNKCQINNIINLSLFLNNNNNNNNHNSNNRIWCNKTCNLNNNNQISNLNNHNNRISNLNKVNKVYKIIQLKITSNRCLTMLIKEIQIKLMLLVMIKVLKNLNLSDVIARISLYQLNKNQIMKI